MIDYSLAIITIGFLWICAASIFDIRTKEVPNWLNFTLIAIVLAFRTFYSVQTSNYTIIVSGLIGLAVFTIIANLLYYLRVFAGGDAKLLMGIGTIIWLAPGIKENLIISGIFILLLLFIGFIYGIAASMVLVIKNWKERGKEFKKEAVMQTMKNKWAIITAAIMLIVLILAYQKIMLEQWIIMMVIIAIMPALLIYAKTIEKIIMRKKISTKKLRVGDWLYQDIELKNGEVIKSRFEGINDDELQELKKSNINVEIRDGIAFVPAILITYTAFIILWYSRTSFFTMYGWLL
jgi:Flp pilus assembly protein protease CpaA